MASLGRYRLVKRYIKSSVRKHGYTIYIRTILAIVIKRLRKQGFDFDKAEGRLAQRRLKGSPEIKTLKAELRSVLGVQYARPWWETSLGNRNPCNGETGLPDLWGHVDDPAEIAIENDEALIAHRERLTSKLRKAQRGLTQQERSIARMSKAGIAVHRIAEDLGISPATVYRRLEGLKQQATDLLREFRQNRVE